MNLPSKNKKNSKGRSGATVGMHRGPGSSKLQTDAAYIKKLLNEGASRRRILSQLKSERGKTASVSTLQSFLELRDEDLQLIRRRKSIRSHTTKSSAQLPSQVSQLDSKTAQDPFEALRRRVAQSKGKSHVIIDESRVY
jgi:hypothetical protein